MGNPITLLLAIPGGEDFTDFILRAQSYPDVSVTSFCTAPMQLPAFLQSAKPEVCILDGNMIDPRSRPVGVEGIGFDKWEKVILPASPETVFLVVLDPDQEELRSRFASLVGVREIVTRPVNVQAVITRAAELGFQRRRQREELSPLAAAAPGPVSGVRAVGLQPILPAQKVIALWSPLGGVGKTTLAMAMWQILNHAGVETLLIGFSRQDPLVDYLDIREPGKDLLQFLRLPTLEGFEGAISYPLGNEWPVITGPRNIVEAERLLREKPPGADREPIRDLIYMARERYSTIILDLPPAREPWSLEPIRRANVVILVLRPTRVAVNQTVYAVYFLLTVSDGRPLVPKDILYTVINGAQPGDTVNVGYLAQAFHSGFGEDAFGTWTPPNLGVVRFDPTLRDLQDRYEAGKKVAVSLPEIGGLGESLLQDTQAILANIFTGALPSLAKPPRRKKLWLF
ncbi:MAG: AAA family ATPase [Thermoproteota archaeon]